MKTRLFILVAATAVLLAGSDKKVVGSARGENQDLTLEVTLYLDPASVKDLIGTELGGHFMLAAVKMEPKYGKQITIDRDDFLLRTDKDGEAVCAHRDRRRRDPGRPAAPRGGRGGLASLSRRGAE